MKTNISRYTFYIMRGITMLIGLALATAAIAQTESTGDSGDLSAGELVPIVEEQHGDWYVICRQPAGGELECTMTQPVLNNLGTPAITINLWPITDSNLFAAAAAIVTPLGTNLENGISLAVDSNSPRRYGFKYCFVEGCLARIGLLNTEVNSMKAGNTWSLVVFDGDNVDAPLQFNMSLTGFTMAFDRLRQILQEGPG